MYPEKSLCILALPSADMGTGSPRILWFFLHDSRRIWTGIHALHLQFRPRVRFLQPHRSHYNYRVRVRSHEPLPESHGSAHHSLCMVWNHEVRCRHIPDDGSQIKYSYLYQVPESPALSSQYEVLYHDLLHIPEWNHQSYSVLLLPHLKFRRQHL